MNRLKSYDDTNNRQQIWEHNGRKFSIVDLTIVPYQVEMSLEQVERLSGLYLDFYKPYQFELADITDDIDVLGRYKSFEEAQAAIRELS